MSTPSLTEFLLARIAEDEAVARTAQEWTYGQDADWWAKGEWWLEGVCMATIGSGGTGSHIVGYSYSDQTATHIARHDPARVLAECEAKRELVTGWRAFLDGAPPWAAAEMPSLLAMARRSLALLALPYADHEEFREGWKP